MVGQVVGADGVKERIRRRVSYEEIQTILWEPQGILLQKWQEPSA